MHVYKVIIVGAGVAGLAAAKFLTENGVHDFIVLEAQDKIGGRIDTKEFGGLDGRIVELGAQWIHGEENDFFRFIKSNGLVHQKTSWEGEGQFLTPNGAIIPSGKVQKLIDWVNEQLDNLEDEPDHCHVPNGLTQNGLKDTAESVGAFLRRNFQQYIEENDDLPQELQMAVFQWANSYHRIDNCCNQMTDLSKLRWADFEINGGELYNNFKTGAQNTISKLSESFLSPSNLRLGHEVSKINWQTEEVQVFVKSRSNHELYLGHSVLITCSIGVLQHSMNIFSPPLPQKTAEAIELTGFGPLTKIFLEWESPWWPTEGFRGIQLLWPNEFINCCDDTYEDAPDAMKTKTARNWAKSITGFDPVLDNPNVLLGWLGGPEAVYVETLDDKTVGDKCVEILRRFTGKAVPPPKAVLVSKWSSNPHIRGAYCYRSLEGDKLGEGIISTLQEPVNNLDDVGLSKPALIFAGEALSRTQYSTLHGAFDSGQQQAKTLLELLRIWEKQRSDCESLSGTV